MGDHAGPKGTCDWCATAMPMLIAVSVCGSIPMKAGCCRAVADAAGAAAVTLLSMLTLTGALMRSWQSPGGCARVSGMLAGCCCYCCHEGWKLV